MSIFSTILSKVFRPADAAPATPAGPDGGPGAAPDLDPVVPVEQAPAQAPDQNVDVEAVLTAMASQKGGGGNWQTSIVDLLKLLDLDSSLSARKELAGELNVHAGADGSAEQNMALSKAVWQQLAQNGGKVPASLRD